MCFVILAEIGTPPAPALLADSLTATSLSLEWQIPARLAEFTKGRSHITRNYLVQWRYEESGNDWKYCRNQSMGDNSTIHVENLQPYTKYRVSSLSRIGKGVRFIHSIFSIPVSCRSDSIIEPWNGIVFRAKFSNHHGGRGTTVVKARNRKSRCRWSYKDINIMGTGTVEKRPNIILCAADQRIQPWRLLGVQGFKIAPIFSFLP